MRNVDAGTPGGFMNFRGLVLLFVLLLVMPLLAQRGAPAGPAKPAPRWPDGHVYLNSPPDEKGLWVGNGGRLAINPNSYEPNTTRNAPIHLSLIHISEPTRL